MSAQRNQPPPNPATTERGKSQRLFTKKTCLNSVEQGSDTTENPDFPTQIRFTACGAFCDTTPPVSTRFCKAAFGLRSKTMWDGNFRLPFRASILAQNLRGQATDCLPPGAAETAKTLTQKAQIRHMESKGVQNTGVSCVPFAHMSSRIFLRGDILYGFSGSY
ncbi:hypothetical protein K3727_06505 [Rhodobacteraceae bacterium M382]|nr:hypothetical protein K3727_06505 [Rhodobacteraceae bacterium M382]